MSQNHYPASTTFRDHYVPYVAKSATCSAIGPALAPPGPDRVRHLSSQLTVPLYAMQYMPPLSAVSACNLLKSYTTLQLSCTSVPAKDGLNISRQLYSTVPAHTDTQTPTDSHLKDPLQSHIPVWCTLPKVSHKDATVRSTEFLTGAYSYSQLPPEQYPEIAIVGRSNVGKSSLVNYLVGSKSIAKVSKQPGLLMQLLVAHVVLASLSAAGFSAAFLTCYACSRSVICCLPLGEDCLGEIFVLVPSAGKTQSINHYLINRSWCLVDCPGYGYAKVSKDTRADWNSFTQQYFKSRRNLIDVLLLVDASLPPKEMVRLLRLADQVGRAVGQQQQPDHHSSETGSAYCCSSSATCRVCPAALSTAVVAITDILLHACRSGTTARPSSPTKATLPCCTSGCTATPTAAHQQSQPFLV